MVFSNRVRQTRPWCDEAHRRDIVARFEHLHLGCLGPHFTVVRQHVPERDLGRHIVRDELIPTT